MKHYLGGLLALALGLVLLVGGGLGESIAAGGQQLPSCSTPSVSAGVVTPACPTGTITVTEQTVQAMAVRRAAAAPTPPKGGWTVTITSANCTDLVGATLNQALKVPNSGSATSQQLFVFSNSSHDEKCHYALAVTPVTGFTSTLTPASPVDLPFALRQLGTSDLPVKLTNTVVAPSPSITPTTPAPVTSSASASVTPSLVSETVLPPSGSASSSAALANTGPKNQVGVSLVAGIALCLLGLVLLAVGRRRHQAARHLS